MQLLAPASIDNCKDPYKMTNMGNYPHMLIQVQPK